MQNITSSIGLKEAIQQLENKRAVEGQLLKEQFNDAYVSLKPANLIKTLTQTVASPGIISNILIATLGLSAGFFTKRIFASTSGKFLKKVFGSILLYSVTRIVTRKPEVIKSFWHQMVQRFFMNKKAVSGKSNASMSG
jgi:hypothetical protein